MYRHGHCVAAHRYRVGYVFGPNYGYTSYSAIPHRYVVRYRLNPDNRYVYSNGYVYVYYTTGTSPFAVVALALLYLGAWRFSKIEV